MGVVVWEGGKETRQEAHLCSETGKGVGKNLRNRMIFVLLLAGVADLTCFTCV